MALLTKDDVPRIRENLRTCADFLRSVRFVLDVNSSEFYTKGAWRDHVVPALCPRDVIGAAREFVASAGVIRENYDHTWGIDVHQQKLVNVNLFLRAAAHHTLAGLGFLLSTQDIFHLFQSSVHTEFQEPSLMCDKKCHEVALLSRLVVALVQHCSLNQVIDIGSGKGYLSSHLSECYGLKVIGIDASNTVTCGAHDRTQKLQKFLSRRQKARCKTGTVPPIVIGESIDNETSGMKIEVGTNTIDTEGESDIHWTTESAVFTGEGCNSVERINTEKMIDTPILMSKNIERVFPETTQTGRPLQPNERQNTDGVQVNVNMEQHFANGLNTSCSSTTISSCEAQRMNNQELVAATERTTNLAGLFSPVTLQLTHKTNLEQLFPALEDSVLVGLHTCGNLGSNILRVFLCHKQLRALSNVGCCYHLLTETSPLGADAEDPCGFPMSQFLLKSGFMLGRNMKMTACLAPERAARGKGLPNESLFRWAVLQVIIRDRFKHVSTYVCTHCLHLSEAQTFTDSYNVTLSSQHTNTWTVRSTELILFKVISCGTQHIGKVCNKTASFLGYCRKAFVLLGLDDSQISDDDITAYHDSYAPRAHELEAFNMLKAALSPCVEAIIFLDRLSFLLEQDLSCHAALVSLFDPAKSPRHYAIVAVKDKQRRATS